MPHPVSLTEYDTLESVWVNETVIFPLSGVCLKALLMRLKNTRSIFSTSTATVGISFALMSATSWISCFRATSLNDSVQSFSIVGNDTSANLRSASPFSYLRKSSIWSMRRRSMATFFLAICINEWVFVESPGSLATCSTGPAISVNGVRRSWETFVKNISFERVACSSWTKRASCFSFSSCSCLFLSSSSV